MRVKQEFVIVPEINGEDPNWLPMARGLIKWTEDLSNPDGTFKDPEMEAEFQEWQRERKGKESA